MKCEECDLYRDAIVGYTCPFREHVDLDADACDSGMKRKADRDARAMTKARGMAAARQYEATEPHGQD